MKRKILLWCIIGVFLFMVSVVSASEYVFSDISSGLVRLHIIANSDEEHDQKIKLLVRDAIIDAQKEIFSNGFKKVLNKEEKQKIITTTKEILNKYGVDYGVVVKTGKFYFPTKKYENITLPAGNYDAVRVILGEGQGKNWWCVMYPPLCFTESSIGIADEESLNILKKNMNDYEYDIITEENIKIVPAFKLVETWQIIKKKIKDSL